MPAFVRAFLFKSSPDGELSYKVKNGPPDHVLICMAKKKKRPIERFSFCP